MRILQVHNHYQQPGGEDQVVAAEAKLLRDHGHSVLQFTASNDRVGEVPRPLLAARTVWNRSAGQSLRDVIRRSAPDVMHVHNTLPILSPAVYYAAHEEGVPVVQTLHNYRLLCPNALLYRGGRICEDCVGKSAPIPAVVHGCYRGSRSASGAVAMMLLLHRLFGTWSRKVHVYIALSEFAQEKFLQGGLPAESVHVKPNFLAADPGERTTPGEYALFVGRLSPEKGVDTLLDAWRQRVDVPPLKIVGDGPAAELLRNRAGRLPRVEWLGRRAPDEIRTLMKGAYCLIVPSRSFETFGLVVIEAFAAGVPVIASDLGALSSLVKDGRTGLHFRPGEAAHLADRIAWAFAHPEVMAEIGRNARREYQDKYSAEKNYEILMAIYERAMERARRVA